MKKIAIAILLSAVVAPAVAADEQHMYAGVRAGPAKTSISTAPFSTDSPTGWGVFVGHIINPNLAIEAEYLNLGEIKGGTGTVKSTGFSVGGVGSFPINEQFSLFGKLGYALITGKPGGSFTGSDRKSRAITYGLGAQFNVSPSVGVRLGWDKYEFNDSGLNGTASMISIGGLFKF